MSQKGQKKKNLKKGSFMNDSPIPKCLEKKVCKTCGENKFLYEYSPRLIHCHQCIRKKVQSKTIPNPGSTRSFGKI